MKVAVCLLALALAIPAYSQPTSQAPSPSTSPPPPPSPPSPPPPPGPRPAPPPVSPPRPAPPPVNPPRPAPGPSQPPAPRPSGPPGPPGPPGPAGPTPPATNNTASPSVLAAGGTPGGPSDADILEFAFNLECFSANFYSCAAFGTPLSSSLSGNGPAPSSCNKANLNSSIATYAAELAREETAHVTALRNLLTAAGRSPVCPAVNIDTAFEAAAEAAFGQSGTPLSPTFDPFANDLFFLHAVFIFEDLSASGYLGAQQLLSNATYRLYAAQIGSNEAYQASLDRTLLYPQLQQQAAYGKTVAQITGAIVSVINQLAGSPQIKYELTNSDGSAIANVDSSGFVPAATAAQALKVLTLGASSGNGGGFFPNNLNGALKN